MERSIAIITARGGSKRIPKKNIKTFCGKPIISYSIQAAVESELFDTVMVSTDSDEIAETAVHYGAQIPFMRSVKTSDDYATTSSVLMEVINQYEKQGEFFQYACCIYPTAPFITASKLCNGMKMLKEKNVDAVIPVTVFSYPPQRGMVLQENGIKLKYPEYIDTRTQDLEKIYHDCGQFYCFQVESFKKSGNLMSGNIAPLVIPELEVQDIDTLEDWRLAEIKYQLTKREYWL